MPAELTAHHDFRSEILDRERTVIVYTPPGYQRDTRRRYPLLLLHDGQNVFDGATSFVPGQHWRAGETADELIQQRKIEPLIIASIYHGHHERIWEYTPTRTQRLGGGGAGRHARMLVEELRPYLRERYRIQPHARHCGIGGSSLGGLAALYTALRYPQVFGKLALLSPSVWWDQREILKRLQAVEHPQRQRIWLDVGTHEGTEPFCTIRDARLLKAMLVTKGWRENVTLQYREIQDGTHSELAWAARLPDVLRFLYPRPARGRAIIEKLEVPR